MRLLCRVVPTLAGTAQLALQESHLCAHNIRTFNEGGQLKSKHFAELGEALSLGTEHAAVLTGGKVIGDHSRASAFRALHPRLPPGITVCAWASCGSIEGTQPRPLQPLGFEGQVSLIRRVRYNRPSHLQGASMATA
jgi:hypothetical protein